MCYNHILQEISDLEVREEKICGVSSSSSEGQVAKNTPCLRAFIQRASSNPH